MTTSTTSALRKRGERAAGRPALSAFLLLAVMLSIFLSSAIAANKREKVIDFDDEVVEGVNKQPLDSLSQVSEADKRRRKPHLYRKRGGFRTETAETLRVLRFTQQ